MPKPLRIGIIGASVKSGWARDAHVPAVRQVAGVELAAVAGSNQASADAAAKAFGAGAAFGDAMDLARSPDVDLVSVCVIVPKHRDLVLAALAAGKHVLCEWPLGQTVAEARAMADAARAAGVHTAIGLQTRQNPAVRRAQALLAAGAIGRVLSARVYSAAAAFGPKVSSAYAFAEDPASGTTLVTIQGGHTIDLAVALLGPLATATGLPTTQYPVVTVGDDGHKRPRVTADHLLVQGRFASGVPLCLEVAGGREPGATPFRLEISGEQGDLLLEGGAARGFQSGTLALSVRGKPEPIAGATADLPDAAVNVAGVYTALRDDIAHGTRTVADFDHAVRLTRMIGDLLAGSHAPGSHAATDG